ncbi:hypothetical protein, variant 2 [Aphanomyces astaci]|uniref:DUF2723 domain-containing protein n=1 Tax=Aphanomyces astaci TaxID=112090 RepID=W4GGV0_APHAT|nr:hypothetical protein, variant 2 [Aphanomyces astaci]ETV78915.1 hypothetical protein, variant 2 [Aphanomyces astaci]|eukprot:XP_009831634.1 hypothetical protein, variant 2 [Aphanomyces astaci]
MQRRRKSKGKEQQLPSAIEEDSPQAKHWKVSVAADPVMWLVGSAVLGVYSQTIYPSIAGGDSGELVAESCHLGVSHPPGYPLFNMLNYLVVNMPGAQTKAWKANLFSAVCDTICCMFMYATILKWTSPASSSTASAWLTKVAAATASITFALSPLIWTYAISAEVFALNNLFAAWLLFLLLSYAQSGSVYYANLGAFVCGLAMCNQHTIVLFEIPVVLYVLWTQRRSLGMKTLSTYALYFVVGLLPYAYMPLTSLWNPQPGSWGDVTTVAGFFHHIRRGDYGTFRLFSTDRDTESLTTRMILYFQDALTRQGGYILGPLAVAGLVTTPPSAPRVAGFRWAVAFMYTFYLIVFHALSNMPLTEGLLYGVHMRFWQQPNIILFVWGGVGLDAVLQRAWRTSGAVAAGLGVVLSVAAMVGQGMTWQHVGNQSHAWFIPNYAKALLDPLPPHALVFVNYDLQWTAMRYLQRCEGFRPDLTVLNLSMMTYKWFATKHALYPSIVFPGDRLVPASTIQDGGFSLRELLQANMKRVSRGGIFLGGQLNFPDPSFESHFITVPFGLLDRFHPAGKPVYKSLKTWYRHNARIMAKVQSHLVQLPSEADYTDDTWEWTARDFHMKQLGAATYLLDEAIKSGRPNITWLAECARPLEHSLRHEPRQFWSDSLLKNLGLAYAYIVRSPDEFAPTDADPLEPHVGHHLPDQTKYKDRATDRMLQVWREWIALPSARADPGYDAIADIVRKFTPTT